MIIYSQASKYGFKKELIVGINLHYLLFLIWRATQHYADFNVQVLVAMDNKNMDKENFEANTDPITDSITNSITNSIINMAVKRYAVKTINVLMLMLMFINGFFLTKAITNGVSLGGLIN
jgi:hypothetical protein